MIAVRIHRVADAVVEGVTRDAAPAGVRAVDPELQAAFLDIAVEIEVADAGLHQRVGIALVDLEDAVHALQIEDDAARQHRCRAAITQVAARRDRIKRYAELIGNTNNFLHLLGRLRRYRRRGDLLLGLVPKRRVSVAVQRRVLVGREHPLAPDDRLEPRHGSGEISLADSRWYAHPLAPRIEGDETRPTSGKWQERPNEPIALRP